MKGHASVSNSSGLLKRALFHHFKQTKSVNFAYAAEKGFKLLTQWRL
jgi:hypothetical protein